MMWFNVLVTKHFHKTICRDWQIVFQCDHEFCRKRNFALIFVSTNVHKEQQFFSFLGGGRDWLFCFVCWFCNGCVDVTDIAKVGHTPAKGNALTVHSPDHNVGHSIGHTPVKGNALTAHSPDHNVGHSIGHTPVKGNALTVHSPEHNVGHSIGHTPVKGNALTVHSPEHNVGHSIGGHTPVKGNALTIHSPEHKVGHSILCVNSVARSACCQRGSRRRGQGGPDGSADRWCRFAEHQEWVWRHLPGETQTAAAGEDGLRCVSHACRCLLLCVPAVCLSDLGFC